MSSPKSVDFYGGKDSALPRFIYRRLAEALQTGQVSRAEALEAAAAALAGPEPDLRKFKFILPPALRRLLTAEEARDLETSVRPRRERYARLKMIFPHVADEFSLDADFLASVLDMGGGPTLAPPGRFFTLGSCFAHNIAQFLEENGRVARSFRMAEDLNSPISNAFIFDVMRRAPQEQADVLAYWSRRIHPDTAPAQVEHLIGQKLDEVQQLAGGLREAECVVLTLGNIVDFFLDDVAGERPLMEKILPKFIALPGVEDVQVRSNATARLLKQGATLRLATYEETKQAIAGCLQGVRSVTNAPIVVTLSPVPVDSTLGLASHLKSAIEVDCVSKSRLRSAFDEVAGEMRLAGQPIHYFPSFEIVRWIAPMLPIPNFGLDDAAARHVSSPILEAICGLFLERFVRWPETAAEADSAPARAGSPA